MASGSSVERAGWSLLVTLAIVASVAPACAVGSTVSDEGGDGEGDDGAGSASASGPATAGAGGASTSTVASSSVAAGVGSTTASASSSVTAASSSSASGGSASCSVKLSDMACSPCAEQSCCMQLEACGPGTQCAAYVGCVNANCPPPNNTMQCVQQACAAEMAGMADNDALVSCICDGGCAASCSSVCG